MQTSERKLTISRFAAVALALVSSYLVFYTIQFMWVPSGDFGIGIDPATATLTKVAPRNAAKGIRVGDRIDLAAMPFSARSIFYQNIVDPVGWRMTLHVVRGGRPRTATLETTLAMHTLDDKIVTWVRKVVCALFIVAGVILVWHRPNVMLWALAVFLIRTHDYWIGPLGSPAAATLAIGDYAVLNALGLPALIVFAARFPDGHAGKTTKYWDALAAAIFVFFVYLNVHDFLPLFTTVPIDDLPGDTTLTILTSVAYLFIFVALFLRLMNKRYSARAGFGWIVAGYGIGIVLGRVGLNDLFDVIDFDSYWPVVVQYLLMLAMPASVAFSVIRYRAFGLGYLANRALVYAALTIGIVSTLFIGAWVVGEFATTFAVGVAMFAGLLAGMALASQRARVVRFVDRVFLPHRYEAALSFERMSEALRGTGDEKRLTVEIVAALGVTSVAVFSRANDGGFVRKAACGWPQGTAWHFLPGEAVTHSLDAGPPIVLFPEATQDEPAFPSANGRPRVALTVRSGGRVERAILVGAYRNGATLDRDAIRSLRLVLDGVLLN